MFDSKCQRGKLQENRKYVLRKLLQFRWQHPIEYSILSVNIQQIKAPSAGLSLTQILRYRVVLHYSHPGCWATTGIYSNLSTVCQHPVMWFSQLCFTSALGSWFNWTCCQSNRLCQGFPPLFSMEPRYFDNLRDCRRRGGRGGGGMAAKCLLKLLSKKHKENRSRHATSAAVCYWAVYISDTRSFARGVFFQHTIRDYFTMYLLICKEPAIVNS